MVDTLQTAPVLRLENLVHAYAQGDKKIEILRGASASLQAGEAVGLLGPSGAGKSTLLHIAGLLERPNGGAVFIDGVDCVKLSDAERTTKRRSDIGFVFQFHHLLRDFTALENVVLPQTILGLSRTEADDRARQLLNLSVSATASNIGQVNSQVANSSAWQSPARSPMGRAFSLLMSRPAISILRLPNAYSTSS